MEQFGTLDRWKIPIKFGRVEGGFFLPNEYCIKTLEGSPKWVGGSFVCQNGLYTNLKGAPEYVGGDFRSADNRNLISLEGAPNKIVGDFNIKYTNIRNFYGIKEFSLGGSYFECLGSPIYYIYTLFYDPRCIDSINEYGAIQGDNIIWDRLVEVYHDLEMNPPDPYEFDVDVLESISTIDHISKGGYKLIF